MQITDERHKELQELYKNRNLLTELAWMAYNVPDHYSNKDKEFVAWLCKTAYEYIKNQTLDDGWTLVTDEMPETNEDVLVKTIDNHYRVYSAMPEYDVPEYYCYCWEDDYGYYVDKYEVEKWRRLPK